MNDHFAIDSGDRADTMALDPRQARIEAQVKLEISSGSFFMEAGTHGPPRERQDLHGCNLRVGFSKSDNATDSLSKTLCF